MIPNKIEIHRVRINIEETDHARVRPSTAQRQPHNNINLIAHNIKIQNGDTLGNHFGGSNS
jgi:hypothetical protein